MPQTAYMPIAYTAIVGDFLRFHMLCPGFSVRLLHPLLSFRLLMAKDGEPGRSGGCCTGFGLQVHPLAWLPLFFPNCLAAFL